jgi:hypothetical protein
LPAWHSKRGPFSAATGWTRKLLPNIYLVPFETVRAS